MKGKKKLLSVLLAAALVGQMGFVVGVSNTGDTAPACSQSDHGMNGHKVTSVNGCESGMHWLGGTGTLQGGTGTNYFYPTANNTTINCAGEKNVVIFKTVPGTAEIGKQAEITITGFKDDTTLYIPQTSNVTADTHNGIHDSEEDESEELEERKLTIDNKCVITIQNENYGVYSGNIAPEKWSNTGLTAPSILEKDGKITVAPEDTTKYTYQWKAEKDGQPLEPVVLDIPTDPGVYQYTCTMIENATGKYSTATYKVTVGCVKKPAIAIDKVKATMGEKVTTNGGTLAALAAEDANILTFTLDATEAITYAGLYCDKTDGENHGYTAAWAAETLPTGVTLAGNQLAIDAGKVVAGTHDVKINLSVTKGETAATGAVTFKLEKAEKQDVGGDSSENSNSNSSETSGSSSESSSSSSSSSSESSSSSSSSESSSSSDGEENSGSNQPDTKPETPPTITIGGGAENENSAPKKIEITKDSEDFSFDYNVTVSNQTNYKVVWTLKTVDNKDAPDYITVTPKDTSATVNIVKEKLPKEGVNAKFALTATLEEATIKAKARAAVADTKNSSKPSVTFDIEVKAEANLNQDTGGPAPTTCTRTIKSVTIAPKDTTPLHFKENDSDKVMDWTYTVEWNNDCNITNCTHKTEDLIWKVKTTKANDWAVLEGNVDTAQKSGKLKIITSKIPDLKDNKITFEAYTKKADGTEDKPVTITGELTITRDPRCEKVISEITGIQSMPGSSANVTVVKGKTVDQHYIANKKYSEGVCEKSPEHNETDGHGGTVTWKLVSAKRNNGTGTITDNEVKAFSVGSSDGSLHIEGTKLVAGKTYTVEIAAIPNNSETKAYKFGVTVKCTAPTSPGTTGGSSSSDDDTDDTDWYQWQDFEDDISDAKRGSTVKVNLRDNTDMPFYIFDEVRGRDVNLQMKVSGGYTWTVNGKTVKKLPENQVWVALGVDSYKNSRMSTLCRSYDVKSFQLENKGSFYGDMKLTMNVGSSYAKKTMFLYSYDEDKNKLTYCSSSKADDTGDVSFVFARSLGAYVVTSKALYGESAVGSGGGTVGGTGSGNSPTTVYPPVASVPASKPPASSSSSSSSSSQSSSSSEPAPPPAEPSSTPDTTPTDTKTEPEQKAKIPVLVPVLILSIAGVITATVLVVRSGRGKEDF